MMDEREQQQIQGLNDVDLVRLLTLQSADLPAEVLEFATQEANRRGVPIDAAFIPRDSDEDPAFEPTQWTAGGIRLECPHCGGLDFSRSTMLMNTRGMTFLSLEWLNRKAHAMQCARCGLVQLFAVPPEAIC